MEKEKKKVLIVIDVQNDFVTGSLGTPEAQAIIPNVKAKIDLMHKRCLFKSEKIPVFNPELKVEAA